jgi:Ca2+/H+ antiporter, TMEM165/GDT1 family
MKKKWFKIGAVVVTLTALCILFFSGTVMLLWNSILQPVLHVNAISLWQAAGILLLARILFGGKGRHRMHNSHCNKRLYVRCEKVQQA